jgi:8-oxo-dGTP pyrophosphatase MutT (NUDIX family)
MTLHALDAATLRAAPRRPFLLDGVEVGSVALQHLPLLAAQPALFDITPQQVAWCGPREDREALLDGFHRRLRAEGHIRAWREEPYAVVDPKTLRVLARIERAASRFWGTLTFGAHATGYVTGPDGRPEQLWIAQRAFDKATDPGLYDNLIGGGVPYGQSPEEALVREAFEEAGLQPAQLGAVQPGSVLQLQRDVPEGLQHEWLHSYDLPLRAGVVPHNQDGEVAAFTLMPVAQALALASGTLMTVDAALVTIDFLLRHGLLDDAAVQARMQALHVPRPAERRDQRP